MKWTFEGIAKAMVEAAKAGRSVEVGSSTIEDYILLQNSEEDNVPCFVVIAACGGGNDDMWAYDASLESAMWALHTLLACNQCEACSDGCVEECVDPWLASTLTLTVKVEAA